jgi:hypothetical protein
VFFSLDLGWFSAITYPYMESVTASIAELGGRFERNREEYLSDLQDKLAESGGCPDDFPPVEPNICLLSNARI